MLAYKLSNNINTDSLLRDIQDLVNKSIKPNKEYLMVIRIQEISYDDDEAIPKLEYHNLDQTQAAG